MEYHACRLVVLSCQLVTLSRWWTIRVLMGGRWVNIHPLQLSWIFLGTLACTFDKGATELTTRFGWESVRLIPRDLGHCPRQRSRRGLWARSRGINPDSHPKRVDNSGSDTTVLATKYLYIDAKCLFLSERWVLFLTCRPSLLFWSHNTNRPISMNKMGLLPCQLVVVPAKTFFWDYCPASRV